MRPYCRIQKITLCPYTEHRNAGKKKFGGSGKILSKTEGQMTKSLGGVVIFWRSRQKVKTTYLFNH